MSTVGKTLINKKRTQQAIRIAILLGIILFFVNPYTIGFAFLQYCGKRLSQIETGGSYNEKEIDNIIEMLQFTTQIMPKETISWRYLARAYKIKKRYKDAIEVLKRASSIAPNSIIINHEVLFLYEHTNDLAGMMEVSKTLGYNEETWISIGDYRLDEGNFEEALRWYEKAVEYNPQLIGETSFRLAIAAISSARSGFGDAIERYNNLIMPFLVSTIDEQGSVLGSQFRWTSGHNIPSSGTDGFLWWNGRVSSVIYVEKAGFYSVRLTVCNLRPPPIDMAFGVNGRIVEQLSLTAGDNTWAEFEMVLFLDKGFSTLDAWFLNDGYINGEDRNAALRKVELFLLTNDSNGNS